MWETPGRKRGLPMSRTAKAVMRLLLMMLTVYAFVMLVSVFIQLQSSRRNLREQQERAELLAGENQLLGHRIEHFSEEENIRRLAEEMLGLVSPKEMATVDFAED